MVTKSISIYLEQLNAIDFMEEIQSYELVFGIIYHNKYIITEWDTEDYEEIHQQLKAMSLGYTK